MHMAVAPIGSGAVLCSSYTPMMRLPMSYTAAPSQAFPYCYASYPAPSQAFPYYYASYPMAQNPNFIGFPVTPNTPQPPSPKKGPSQIPRPIIVDYIMFRLRLESQTLPAEIQKESIRFLNSRYPQANLSASSRIFERWYRNKDQYVSQEEIARFPPAEWARANASRGQRCKRKGSGTDKPLDDSMIQRPPAASSIKESSARTNLTAAFGSGPARPIPGESRVLDSAGDDCRNSIDRSADGEDEGGRTQVEESAARRNEGRTQSQEPIPLPTSLTLVFRKETSDRGRVAAREAISILMPAAQSVLDAGYDSEVQYLGHGTYGTVLGLSEKDSEECVTALKISRAPGSYRSVLQNDLGAEAAAMWLSAECSAPFGVGGSPKLFGPSCMAVVDAAATSAGTPVGGLYYGVFAMQAGHITGSTMMKRLNQHFKDKNGIVTKDAWKELWSFFASLLEAISLAHTCGLALRDLKPDNFVIWKASPMHKGQTKRFHDPKGNLIDFGSNQDVSRSEGRRVCGMSH